MSWKKTNPFLFPWSYASTPPYLVSSDICHHPKQNIFLYYSGQVMPASFHGISRSPNPLKCLNVNNPSSSCSYPTALLSLIPSDVCPLLNNNHPPPRYIVGMLAFYTCSCF
uniref:Uncharacterized protein n=1 Tax=Opuntia streptacantha TaxID=393608 RepID=A0A7C9ESC9_OPUST